MKQTILCTIAVFALSCIGIGLILYSKQIPMAYKPYEGIYYCSESKHYCFLFKGRKLIDIYDDGEQLETQEYRNNKKELLKNGIEIVSIDEDKLVLRKNSTTKTYINSKNIPKKDAEEDD